MSAKQALISSLRSSDILEMKALESFSLTPSLGYVANRSLHRQTTLVYEAKLSLLNPIFKSDHRPQGFRKPSWIWRSKFSITVESSKCSQNFCRRAVKCSACNNGTEQECGVLQQIQTLCGGEISEEESEGRPQFIEGKLLSEVSTWGIGGPAKYFMEVHSEAEMVSLTRYCKRHNVRIIVIGKGSNCLFDDLGFDGCVILNCIDYVENPERGMYRVGSGHAFNQLGVRCSKEGYTGLEFACGIPGTVGGAVYMNAGANGQDTAHVLKSVEILTVKGERIVLLKEKGDLKYSYRRSPFQMMQNFGAVTAATFELVYNPESKQRHIDLLRRRKENQPLTEKSAGCVFRNPSNAQYSAGALIDQAGLKGFSIGDAKVSELHANFLVNSGKCNAADMLSLIAMIKEQVQSQFDIELQEEIKFIPYS